MDEKYEATKRAANEWREEEIDPNTAQICIDAYKAAMDAAAEWREECKSSSRTN